MFSLDRTLPWPLSKVQSTLTYPNSQSALALFLFLNIWIPANLSLVPPHLESRCAFWLILSLPGAVCVHGLPSPVQHTQGIDQLPEAQVGLPQMEASLIFMFISCSLSQNFYKSEINKEEMYIRYIHKLCDMHLQAENYTGELKGDNHVSL